MWVCGGCGWCVGVGRRHGGIRVGGTQYSGRRARSSHCQAVCLAPSSLGDQSREFTHTHAHAHTKTSTRKSMDSGLFGHTRTHTHTHTHTYTHAHTHSHTHTHTHARTHTDTNKYIHTCTNTHTRTQVRFGSAAVMLDVSLLCITAAYWFDPPPTRHVTVCMF